MPARLALACKVLRAARWHRAFTQPMETRMDSLAQASAQKRHRPHAAWLLALAAALALALGLHGPVAQWARYHDFADARSWLGVPNAQNVLSNLPFLLIGVWGLWQRMNPPAAAATRSSANAWFCFSLALIGTAFGSALYHWAPTNAALVFDRLPIAWACAALLCAFLAERLDVRWAGGPALAAALTVASAAVAWWWLGESRGHGDLRPYLFVQFLPMLLVPTALWLKLPAREAAALPDATWWAVLGLYAAAKLMELADRGIFDMLALTSGHTLKHLLAAAAALWLLRGRLRSGSRR
jgi:hypothetical protein